MTRPTPPRTSKRSSSQSATPRAVSSTPNPYALNPNPEVVDPVWLLKALGVIVAGAMLCGYLTLCVLFYHAQWQMILHPTRSTLAPATIGGAPYETVRFAVDDSGTPQLVGWWLPASPGGQYASDTILYLPSGDGSLADDSSTLAALRALGIGVFAFDYRGYGNSAPIRPNQHRMEEDAASAYHYLTASRALQPKRIVPFGTGVGAALAAQLAQQHPQLAALIVRDAKPALLADVLADPRTKLLPVRLLFHNRFEIAPVLTALTTPKLLIVDSSTASRSAAPAVELYRSAADPKFTVSLPPNSTAFATTLTRFLDQYLTPQVAPLTQPK